MTARRIDTLVRNAVIITMDAARHIYMNGSLAVDGGRIVAVGASAEIDPLFAADQVVDGRGFIVTPGFINSHVHITGDPLTRGFMADTTDYRQPDVFANWVMPRFLEQSVADERVSAELAAFEMLRCGITCFLEAGTVRYIDAVAESLASMKIRARIGLWTEGRPFDPSEDPVAASDAAIAAMERTVDAYPVSADSRIAAWPILIGHNCNSDAVWQAAKEIADARGLGLSAHMSPYASDTEWYLDNVGRRPIEHLAHLGVLGDNLVLTHVTHLADSEFDLLADSGTHIVYCPLAALKGAFMASHKGRYPDLVRRGTNLVFGTDGYDCDIMRLLPMASGTFKDARGDVTLFSAHEMLEAITVNAARALRMSDDIGSLEAGKRADFVFHDTNRPELRPLLNPVNQLVWSADGRGVHSVWIDGERVIDAYRSTFMDEAALLHRAQEAGAALVERARLPLNSPWPIIP